MKSKNEPSNDYDKRIESFTTTIFESLNIIRESIYNLNKRIDDLEQKVKSNEDYLEGFEKAASIFMERK